MTGRSVAGALVFPVVMLASVGAAQWGLERGVSVGLWGFAITVANLGVIAVLEQILPLRRDANLLRDPQVLNDIGHGVLLTSIGRPIGSNLSVLALAVLAGAVGEHATQGLAIWPTAWAFPAQLLLALLMYSFLDYWKHRAYHRFDGLWWIHAIHHDTDQMHVMKAGRLHLLEGAIRFLLVSTPLLLLGAPPDVFIWVGLWMNFEGNLNHSNLDQRFPSWFHYLVPTVQVHHIHHARERALQESNFSGVITLWDVLFGTFRHPDANAVESYGLTNETLSPNFARQLLYPLERWFGMRTTSPQARTRTSG